MLAVCLVLLLGVLAGCGGGDGEETEITAGDFTGCWEYEDYDSWLVVYEDGTYDWDWEGILTSGSYTIEGDELVLDEGYRFTMDGAGGLVDSDGDALFASELPEEGQSGGAASIEDFYGCWEYDDTDIGIWIDIRDDGTYIWHWGIGSSSGEYYLEGEELVTDNGRRYTLDGMGGLVDDEGDTLSPSQLPDSGSDGDESVDEDIFQSFVGYWGYDDYDVWAYIYDDGTCEWYSSNGTSISGSCWMEGEVLRMELEDDTVMEFSLQGDGLVDHEGDTLSWSTVPDNLGENDWDDEEDDWYYEEPAAGGEGFVGCWEAATADVWLCIYDDGTFEWYEGGSLGRSSTYEIYEDEICLDMGADMWLTLDDDGWLCHETEDLEMFPSQLPDYLR